MLLGGMSMISALVCVWTCLANGAGWHLIWQIPVSFLGSFLGLLILAFLFLFILCQFVDPNKPQEHDSRFYRKVLDAYINLVFTLGRVRVRTEGLEQTPKQGRFLLVCNHVHEVDPIILLQHFPKSQLAFITKKEVTRMFLVGKYMHKLLCQPLDRENDREALKTILNCIRLIKEDKVSIGVFPEGYIKPDRKLHHFRPGVFKIATKTKVPIVVCTLKNSLPVVSNLLHLRPSDVQLRLIRTIQPEEYEDMTTVELAEMVYRMMADDLGPELVSQEEEEIS